MPLRFSPDNQTLLTAGTDKVARLWDLEAGEEIGPAAYHTQAIHAAAFSPDGTRMLTCGDDGVCQLHGAQNRPLALPGDSPAPRKSASFASAPTVASPWPAPNHSARQKERFASGRSRAGTPWDGLLIRAWFWRRSSARTGERSQQPAPTERPTCWMSRPASCSARACNTQGWVHAVAFSPDGKRLLTACEDGVARLWEVPSGRYLDRQFRARRGHRRRRLQPDGALALTCSSDKTAAAVENRTAAADFTFSASRPGPKTVFSPDGRAAVTASLDRTARIWDVATGQPLGKPLPHQDEVLCARFSPDGKLVVTGSKDQTAQVWRVSTTEPLGAPLSHQGPVLRRRLRSTRCDRRDGQRRRNLSDLGRRHVPPRWASPCAIATRSTEHRPEPRRRALDHRQPDKTARIWELPGTLDGSPERAVSRGSRLSAAWSWPQRGARRSDARTDGRDAASNSIGSAARRSPNDEAEERLHS